MKTFTWTSAAPALLVIAASVGCGGKVAVDETGAVCPAPHLYSAAHHQSPVRGDGGDLLLLAGTGFTKDTFVAYQATDVYGVNVVPSPLPTGSSASEGIIVDDVWPSEHGIELRLPGTLDGEGAYTLWAVTPCGEGIYAPSNGVMINDARPLWVSPGPQVKALGAMPATEHPFLYDTGSRDGLPRELVIVGRNLQPRKVSVTLVRLCPLDAQGQADCLDPATLIMKADDDQDDTTQIERYVARVHPPDIALPGDVSTSYAIQVSRDGGANWVAPTAPSGEPELLTVVRKPGEATQLFATHYGLDCDPCADNDHTHCLTDALKDAAILAANNSAPVDVVFGTGSCGNGVWRIKSGCLASGCSLFDGYVVPSGVNLIGVSSGPALPVIEAGPAFGQDAAQSVVVHQQFLFSLQGQNVVRGLTLRDATPPGTKAPGTSGLVLGGDDITITGTTFSNLFTGIGFSFDANLVPITDDHLRGVRDVVVTDSSFGCWDEGLSLSFAIEDGIIRDNELWPGGAWTPIALAVFNEKRVAIEGNVINGTVTTYSGDDAHSPVGWRAGMFFPTVGSHEEILIADNKISCTGTRPGSDHDGEAISIDGHAGDLGLVASALVLDLPPSGAGTSALTIKAELVDPGVTDPGFFLGRWVRIGQGTGLGQARRIVEPLPTLPSSTGSITLTVAPPFDVAPVVGESGIVISSEAWQMHIVDNLVDNSCTTPKAACSGACAPDEELCIAVDRCIPRDPSLIHYYAAGLINVYGSGTDLGIEGNTLIQTGGIAVYAAQSPKLATQTSSCFVDVRSNVIDGVFGGLSSGKMNIPENSYGAGIRAHGVTVDLVRPGFGLSIAHNVIANAALFNLSGGGVSGIAVSPFSPETQSPEPFFEDTLVFANEVQGMGVAGSGLHSAIANGSADPANPPSGQPNYPANTVVCGNKWSKSLFSTDVGDWVAPGQSSTLHHCVSDPPSP